jgi:hypothetical protein
VRWGGGRDRRVDVGVCIWGGVSVGEWVGVGVGVG